MEIFTVMIAIAAWCGDPGLTNLTANRCRSELISCVAPKEGASIKYQKITACFKEQTK